MILFIKQSHVFKMILFIKQSHVFKGGEKKKATARKRPTRILWPKEGHPKYDEIMGILSMRIRKNEMVDLLMERCGFVATYAQVK
jgi:hypothetical protein